MDPRRLAPARWVPARSRAGIQAFSRESPDAKSRGGWPSLSSPPSWGDWWFFLDQRRLEPARWFPARLRAGARLSPEKAGGKSAGGGAPWTPSFMARSLPLARFGGCAALFRSFVYFGAHLRALIWGLSFGKILFSIFSLENASQIGFSILEVIASRTHQRKLPQKLASGNERL